MALERLQKILARAGITSRRKAEKLMLDGRVIVNGKVANQLGMRADADIDYIKVDGRLLSKRPGQKYYFIAFKPQRMITSLADPRGRPTIVDMLQAHKIRTRVFPVGRLDWDADGLLFLTNDGELANRVMHPRTHLPKIYHVKVNGFPYEYVLQRIRRGVMIGARIKTLPAKIAVLRRTSNSTWLKITLVEGRKNQIKRMFRIFEHTVLRIRRVCIGPLNLGRMKIGEVRQLKPVEVKHLKEKLGMASRAPHRVRK